jgi:hypothetical protein
MSTSRSIEVGDGIAVDPKSLSLFEVTTIACSKSPSATAEAALAKQLTGLTMERLYDSKHNSQVLRQTGQALARSAPVDIYAFTSP